VEGQNKKKARRRIESSLGNFYCWFGLRCFWEVEIIARGSGGLRKLAKGRKMELESKS